MHMQFSAEDDRLVGSVSAPTGGRILVGGAATTNPDTLSGADRMATAVVTATKQLAPLLLNIFYIVFLVFVSSLLFPLLLCRATWLDSRRENGFFRSRFLE